MTAMIMAAIATASCAPPADEDPELGNFDDPSEMDDEVPWNPNGAAPNEQIMVGDASLSGDLANVSDINFKQAHISGADYGYAVEYAVWGSTAKWDAMVYIFDADRTLSSLPVGQKVNVHSLNAKTLALLITGCSGPDNQDETPGETIVVNAADQVLVGNTSMISYDLTLGFTWEGQPQEVDVSMLVSK